MHKMDRSPSKSARKHISALQSNNQLRLSGSQVNLVARSQNGALKSPLCRPDCKKIRPSSALQSFEKSPNLRPAWRRPMSADNDSGNRARVAKINFLTPESVHYDEDKSQEQIENMRSSYTQLSSRLLRSLLSEPWNSDGSESSSNEFESEKSLRQKIHELTQGDNHHNMRTLNSSQPFGILKTQTDTDSDLSKLETKSSSETESTLVLCVQDLHKRSTGVKRIEIGDKDELLDMKFQRWFQQSTEKTEKIEEKTVRFVEQERNKMVYASDEEDDDSDLCAGAVIDTHGGMSVPEHLTRTSPLLMEAYEGKTVKQDLSLPKTRSSPLLIDLTSDVAEANNVRWRNNREKEMVCSSSCGFSCCEVPVLDREPLIPNKPQHQEQQQQLTPRSSPRTLATPTPSELIKTPRDSTYEDLVDILHVLEQGEVEAVLDPADDLKIDVEEPVLQSNKKDDQLRNILSYLDEVERCSEEVIDTAKMRIDHASVASQGGSHISAMPRLEELLHKNPVEVAHEVICLRLQVEDQKGGIKLLQQTIVEMKESSKAAESEHQDALCKLTTDSEAAVQRHQKFVKQLLGEKKILNDKVSTLVEDVRSSEERYQRNMKAMEERHLIEIQRVKETQAVAEKLKREKWIDVKTQKIKEMTVKGLEPELSRMAARQQQEMTELRNLHRGELEAVEMKHTRKTAELLDQQRADLTKEKEEALQRELTAQRARLEKQMEEGENNLQHEAKRMREEVRREKERLAALEAQLQDTLTEARRGFERERERDRQRSMQEAQERTEQTERRHQGEVKALKEALEVEKETWMNNYKKQQTTKFLEREADLHHQYKRERDRDIEMVIERLENEATQTRLDLMQASENKLKRLKEKMEAELREVEASEAQLKTKLSECKTQLAERDDHIVQLNSSYRHLHTEMIQLKKLCEEMAAERTDLKAIIRKEFENQLFESAKDLEILRNEVAALKTVYAVELAKRDHLAVQEKAEAQKELNQVYARVKMTVGKKDEALEALREQHRAALERCGHLEKMLENQRRNLLLK